MTTQLEQNTVNSALFEHWIIETTISFGQKFQEQNKTNITLSDSLVYLYKPFLNLDNKCFFIVILTLREYN